MVGKDNEKETGREISTSTFGSRVLEPYSVPTLRPSDTS